MFNPALFFKVLTLVFLASAAVDCLSYALGHGSYALGSTGSTYANLTAALKRRYDDAFLGKVTWSKGPLAAMLRKKAWSGEFPVYMMRVGNSPARSADFATAQTKAQNATYGFTRVKQAQLAWYKDYGVATIDGLLMATASDKMGTVYDKFVAQIDGILDATMHSISTKVYRSGWGVIGKLASTTNVTTTTGILDVKEDVVLFEVGQDIVFSSSIDGATLRNSAGVLTVTGIDLNLGQLTFNAAINTNTGTLAGDYMFSAGDRQNSATPSRLALAGLGAWLPFAAPATSDFMNLGNRNLDGRLLGTVVDATTLTEEEALIQAAVEASRVGGKPRMAFFNPTRYGNLLAQGQGRYRPTTVTGNMGIGFEGVVVQTNYGDIRVFSDLYCPRDAAWLLEMDSWSIYGAGTSKLPDFITADGNKILRQTADDGVECRVGAYDSMGTNAPCHNVVMKFTATQTF